MVVGTEPEVDAFAYGLAVLRGVGLTETAEHAQRMQAGPVPGSLVVRGATRLLLVGPGTVLFHVRTFRLVEVLLVWRQDGEDWVQARNALQRVFAAQASAFDLFEGDEMPQGEASESASSSHASTDSVACRNPTCEYAAHTEVDDNCVFYGYCCGCCRLRHRNEYCILDHGPRCQLQYPRSLNWGDGAALLAESGTTGDPQHGDTVQDRRGDGSEEQQLALLSRLMGEESHPSDQVALPPDRPRDEALAQAESRPAEDAETADAQGPDDWWVRGENPPDTAEHTSRPMGEESHPSDQVEFPPDRPRDEALAQAKPTPDGEPSRPAAGAETAGAQGSDDWWVLGENPPDAAEHMEGREWAEYAHEADTESSERDESCLMSASEACAAGIICEYCWRALTPDGDCCPRRREAQASGEVPREFRMCQHAPHWAAGVRCEAGGGAHRGRSDLSSTRLESQASHAREQQAVSDSSNAAGENGEGQQAAWSPGGRTDAVGSPSGEVPREFRMCQHAPHWTCPQCGRSNWRTRTACHQCEQPHPDQASHTGALVEEALSRQEQEQAATAGRGSEHPAVRRIRARATSRSQGVVKQYTPQQWKEWRQRKGSGAAGPSARRPGAGPNGA